MAKIANMNGQVTKKWSWLIVLTIVICFHYVGNYTTEGKKISKKVNNESANNQRAKVKLPQKQLKMISRLIDLESIYIQFHDAHIDPHIWHGIELRAKRNLASAISIYCGNADNSRNYFCDIYDKVSGKKIAEYDSLGFTVY